MKVGKKMLAAKTVAMMATYMVILLWRARPGKPGLRRSTVAFTAIVGKCFVISAGGGEV
jgi:hypothetical protein